MALTDVLFMSANAAEADRGDIGTLEDTTANVSRLFIALPDASAVQIGVDYGHQGDEFTGAYTGGGNTYSRGRVVNA